MLGGRFALGSCLIGVLVAALASCAPQRPMPDLDEPVGMSLHSAPFPVDEPEPRPSPVEPPSPCPPQLPSFVFPEGSAIVSPSQDLELHRLALCLTVGPLRGARVIAVGHGDAVGPDAVNLAVGLARASKVREFLVAHGAAGERILASSTGERSTAAARPGRRVDLYLVPIPPAAERLIE